MREAEPPKKSRAARRRAKRTRTICWLAACLLAAAGLILLTGALKPGADLATVANASPANGVSAASIAPVVAPTVSGAPDAPGLSPSPSAMPFETPGASLAASPSSTPAPVRLTISAAGDCTLGGDTSSRTYAAFAKAYKAGGPEYFLKNVMEIFQGDDLTVVNLEGPLTKAKKCRVKEFAFKGDPAYVKILTEGGVEAANLSNNHAKDYYGAGLNDTAKVLKDAGVARFGWGKDEILTVKGVKVGLCGFGVWYISVKGMQKEIQDLKKQCDVVIASIHGGEEGEGLALKVQRSYGRAAVQAGASLVLGHHPHVIGGIEKYQGATIVYSLGNFCFGGNLNPDDKDTFIFQQTFEISPDGPVAAGELVIPCSISGSKSKNDYQPAPLTGQDAQRVLNRIEKLSKDFDTPIDLTASRERLQK
jgi:poly-gamma-glutamate synthesis protein (capsule biosynthesis protein)